MENKELTPEQLHIFVNEFKEQVNAIDDNKFLEFITYENNKARLTVKLVNELSITDLESMVRINKLK